MGVTHQRRDNRGDGEPRVARVPGMAAASPAILVILLPDAAELIGQSLAHVAVTGHAPVPVQVASQLVFGGILRQRRLGQGIVCRCRGKDSLLCNRVLKRINDQQDKEWQEQGSKLQWSFY